MDFFFIVTTLASLLMGEQQSQTSQNEFQDNQIESMINSLVSESDNYNANAQYDESQVQNYQAAANDTGALPFIGGQAGYDIKQEKKYAKEAKQAKQQAENSQQQADTLSDDNDEDNNVTPP